MLNRKHVLSRFSRVQLCDAMDYSPPGSSGPWDSPGKNTGVGCHSLLRHVINQMQIHACLLYSPKALFHGTNTGFFKL